MTRFGRFARLVYPRSIGAFGIPGEGRDPPGEGRDPFTADDAPADKTQLGAAAKRLLDDPVLALALGRIEEKLTQTWRNTTVGAVDEREAAYRLVWAIEHLRSELRAMVGNAKILEAEQQRRDDAERRDAERRTQT